MPGVGWSARLFEQMCSQGENANAVVTLGPPAGSFSEICSFCGGLSICVKTYFRRTKFRRTGGERVRERETETETERQTERETERERTRILELENFNTQGQER